MIDSCPRRVLAAAALAAALLLGAAPAAAQAGSDAAQVREQVETLAAAVHARDRDTLEALLAPGFTLRAMPDLDRETWLRNALTFCWGDRSDITGLRVRLDGDVAVASFELASYVDPVTCAPAVLRSLVTDVWERTAEGWRLALRHSSAAADDPLAGQFAVSPPLPPEWLLSGELSLVATGGTTSTRTAGVGSTVVHRAGTGVTRLAVTFLTSEAGEATTAESLSGQARHGRALAEWLEIFGRGTFLRDRFAGIDARAGLELGGALKALTGRPHTLSLEAGLGAVTERRLDASRLRFVSGTGGLRYAWAVRPRTDFLQEAAVTVNLGSPADWRGTSSTSLTVALTNVVSLRASHAFEYRNAPVPGFGGTDSRSAAALVVSLERRR